MRYKHRSDIARAGIGRGDAHVRAYPSQACGSGLPPWPQRRSSLRQAFLFFGGGDEVDISKFRLNLNFVKVDSVATVVTKLRAAGIQPSAQRVAIGEYVLFTDEHPSADQVWERVKKRFPMVSRATVYNTLNAFVEARLLRELVLSEGRTVFDPKIDRHHHFIDEATGTIHDVDWNSLRVSNVDSLKGFQVNEYQVVLRGLLKRA